jgi:hypothetical protein
MPSILELMMQPRGPIVRGPNFNPNIPPQPFEIRNPPNPMEIAQQMQDSPPDVGYMPPMDASMMGDIAPQEQGDALPIARVAPATMEWLGAKEPEQDNIIKQILANRKPRGDEFGEAAIKTLMSGEFTSSQDIANKRMDNDLASMSLLAKMQSNANGGATMMAAERLMQEAAASGNPISFSQAFAMSKSGLSPGNAYNPQTGQVNPIEGYAPARETVKYSEGYGNQSGQNRANIQDAGTIEMEKQMAQLRAEQQGLLDKKATAATGALGLLDEAELYLDSASGSIPGAAWAAGKSAFEVVGQNLVSQQPRMEGPQSNFDVQLYQRMAGKIADPTVPADDKRAAIGVMRKLNEKYAGMQSNPNAPTYQGNQGGDDSDLLNYMTPEEKALFGQ